MGEPRLDLDDIVSDWSSPSLDLAFDTVLVNCGDEPVAFIQVDGERADGVVHPAWRGRGLSALVGRHGLQHVHLRRSPGGLGGSHDASDDRKDQNDGQLPEREPQLGEAVIAQR